MAPNENIDSLVLISGGPLSTTLLYSSIASGDKPLALHYIMKSRDLSTSENASKEIASEAKVTFRTLNVDERNLDFNSRIMATIIREFMGNDEEKERQIGPAILISMTVTYAIKNHIPKVYFSLGGEDKYDFNAIDNINKILEHHNCQILTPFRGKKSSDIIEESRKLKIPIDKTWACETPTLKGTECEICYKCKIKKKYLNK